MEGSGRGRLKDEEGEKVTYELERRQMVWKEMVGKEWVGMLEGWGVAREEAFALLKAIAAVMREVGPKLGQLPWETTVRAGEKTKLTQQAMEMMEADTVQKPPDIPFLISGLRSTR